MSTDYTYAVARIRTKETALFSRSDLEQLISCADVGAALTLLQDKGWGSVDGPVSAEAILEAETAKTWDLVNELEQDPAALAVFKLSKDYHNLKAAVKYVFTGTSLPKERLFQEGGVLKAETILKAIEDKDYSLLPEKMAAAAAEAAEVLSHTGDGQLCDILIDRACLDALYAAGKAAREPVLREYAAVTVVSADIRTALRAARAKKPLGFIEKALAPCDELDVSKLAEAAIQGKKAVAEYLSSTQYAFLVPSLEKSMSAFECSCDNMLIDHMRPQKSNPFTLGPIAAYVLARENEIKCVRMILTGKQNRLPDEFLRESMREMYV